MVTSYQLGVNAYVVKPVDFHEFVNAVKDMKKGDVSPVDLDVKNPKNKDSGLVWAYGGKNPDATALAKQIITAQQALKRRGLPEEQAATIVFLASDDSAWLTGERLTASGGYR